MEKKEKSTIKLPTLEELLKAGSHFGHKTSAWEPKMQKYIYDSRNGVHIIDLVSTMSLLKKAAEEIQKASDKGHILIVGTKGQAASLVEKVAMENGAFYINKRWPGGLFTNFKTIKKSVDKLVSMEERLAEGASDLVKKEQLLLSRDVERLNKIYTGIKFMDKLPSLIIVIDSKVEKNAIREANNVGIPIVALLDTNCDPEKVTYPIPANDDSLKSINLFLDVFARAIKGGTKSAALVTMRKAHDEKLSQMRREFEAEVERVRMMQEEERERMKALREGKVVEHSKIRVLKSASENESTGIEVLKLSARVEKALKEAGITDVTEVRGKTKSELVELPGIGPKAADDILKAIN